ncbi:MAG: ATP-grasp domain-containing protein [Cyanobacteria bacterium P01_G01_bin.49]
MNIVCIEQKLTIINEKSHVAVYDFDFELFFNCTHPVYLPPDEICVLRIGAIKDYAIKYEKKQSIGLKLINSPQEHRRASELEQWYPLIRDITPRSICVNEFPPVDEIEKEFGWPIFLKGSRQTSKHNPDLSIIKNEDHYGRVRHQYHEDSILNWQKIVIREFVELEPVAGSVPGKIVPSLEYRTFWWYGKCVGCGQYWHQIARYETADIDIEKGLKLAGEASLKVNVPFLVIDIAKTVGGQWLVIECNDGQESGYAGIIPQILWQNILSHIHP